VTLRDCQIASGRSDRRHPFNSIYLKVLHRATVSPSPLEDCELGRYKLKGANTVTVSSRVLQIDRATWHVPGHPELDPAFFWPDRFLDGDKKLEEDRADEVAEAEENAAAAADATMNSEKGQRR
jgi:hypothetical protein